MQVLNLSLHPISIHQVPSEDLKSWERTPSSTGNYDIDTKSLSKHGFQEVSSWCLVKGISLLLLFFADFKNKIKKGKTVWPLGYIVTDF